MVVTGSLFFSDEVLSGLISLSEGLVETLISNSSLVLVSSSGLGSLGLDDSSSLGMSISLLLGKDFSLLGSEWVESVHEGFVGEWVLSGLIMESLVSSNGSKLGLNLIRVDDSGKISAGHHGSVKSISGLVDSVSVVGTVEVVQGGESILGEDNESSEVTTWSKLDDVKSANVAYVNTWEVSSGSLDIGGGIGVDDEWSLLQDVLGVSVLSSSSSEVLGGSNLGEIVSDTEVVEGGNEGFGVWDSEAIKDKWEFWDVLNLVTSGHNKRSNGRSSKSGGNSMSSLGDVDSSVPLSPDLEWGEHSSLSAHVTEGGLTRS